MTNLSITQLRCNEVSMHLKTLFSKLYNVASKCPNLMLFSVIMVLIENLSPILGLHLESRTDCGLVCCN